MASLSLVEVYEEGNYWRVSYWNSRARYRIDSNKNISCIFNHYISLLLKEYWNDKLMSCYNQKIF